MLAVFDKILITGASYHRAYSFVSGLLAAKFVGQNSVVISGLVIVSLYIQFAFSHSACRFSVFPDGVQQINIFYIVSRASLFTCIILFVS